MEPWQVALVVAALGVISTVVSSRYLNRASTKSTEASDLTTKTANLLGGYEGMIDRKDREIDTLAKDRDYWRDRALKAERKASK